jgi:dTDP-4-dehydrorhamnose 3,5-epimerase
LRIEAIKELPLAGAKLVEYARFHDRRGYFAEVWHRGDFDAVARAIGRESLDFVQINESRSLASVMRGLHFQIDPPMGKLVRVLYGRTLDIALDMRAGSPTFGRMMLVELAMEAESGLGRWLWLPPGLAHGNLYLEDSAIEYFCDACYNPAGEVGVNPLDPELDPGDCPDALRAAYEGAVAAGPILSDRDRAGLSLADWRRDPRAALVRW